MNILVTGGAGYIGSHCAKLLCKKGHHVINYDNLSRGFISSVRYGDFVKGDINEADLLDYIFQEFKIDAVMHFAAFAYVGESVEKPDMYMQNNLANTGILVDCMIKNRIKYLIFSSSCATYGIPEYLPIDEKHNQKPINPYGLSKFLAEQAIINEKALKSIIFRYFNAAGCDPDGELGELHNPETHLIPLAIQAAMGAGKPLKVFGHDYNTLDGTCVRDYIHVNDISNAHILGLEHLVKNNTNEVFNLGNGNGFSVQEVIWAIRRITGKDVPFELVSRRAGDPAILVGNADKAKQILNWKIQYSSLEDIIETAYQWEKKNI